MKNILLLALALSFTLSDSFGGARRSPKPKPTPPPIVTEPAPAPEFFGARFYPIIDYTTEEREVLAIAEHLGNTLIQSQCFEDYMLKRGLRETEGRTPQGVVDHLRSQSRTIAVKMYYTDNSTVGYRWAGGKDQNLYTNRKFHAGATACDRGSNLFHEWTHFVGYDHGKFASRTRPYTVPYSTGRSFDVCCVCTGPNKIKNCSIK